MGRVERRRSWAVGFLLAVGMVGFSALLLWIHGGALARAMATPFLYLGWFVDRLPQVLVWGTLVVLGVLVSRRMGRRQARVRRFHEPSVPSQDGLETLARQIRMSDRSLWSRRRLGARLSRTAVAIRVRREGLEPEVVWRELRSGQWPRDKRLAEVLRPPRRGRLGDAYAHDLEHSLSLLEGWRRGDDLEHG